MKKTGFTLLLLLIFASCIKHERTEIRCTILNCKSDTILVEIDSGLCYRTIPLGSFITDENGSFTIAEDIENPASLFLHYRNDSIGNFLGSIFIVPGKEYTFEADARDQFHNVYGKDDIVNNFKEYADSSLYNKMPNICTILRNITTSSYFAMSDVDVEYNIRLMDSLYSEVAGRLDEKKRLLSAEEYQYLSQSIISSRYDWLYRFGQMIKRIPVTDKYYSFIDSFNLEPQKVLSSNYRTLMGYFVTDAYRRGLKNDSVFATLSRFDIIDKSIASKCYRDFYKGYYLYFGLLSWNGVNLHKVDSLYSLYIANKPDSLLLAQVNERLDKVRLFQHNNKK